MTNEEYMRVLLLGGMQLTRMLPRGSALMLRNRGEPEGIFSLPELERLQLTALGAESPWSESVSSLQHLALNAVQGFYKARRTSAEISEDYQSHSRTGWRHDLFSESIVNDALIRVSQGAQWHSLRADILSRLKTLYVFRNESRVRSFIERNSFLAPLLLQANSRIREYFNASTIALEISIDPENVKYQELWARIQTHLSPGDALPILTRFDHEWWLQASATSKNLLNIKLEYV